MRDIVCIYVSAAAALCPHIVSPRRKEGCILAGEAFFFIKKPTPIRILCRKLFVGCGDTGDSKVKMISKKLALILAVIMKYLF
jgi:hypothetical protein